MFLNILWIKGSHWRSHSLDLKRGLSPQISSFTVIVKYFLDIESFVKGWSVWILETGGNWPVLSKWGTQSPFLQLPNPLLRWRQGEWTWNHYSMYFRMGVWEDKDTSLHWLWQWGMPSWSGSCYEKSPGLCKSGDGKEREEKALAQAYSPTPRGSARP